MLPSPTDIQGELARRSFSQFVPQAWPLVAPGAAFVPGIHIDAICDVLEAIHRGEIRRLLINVPPRHGKTLLTSVLWPAWVWASNPATCFLFASYGQLLSSRDSIECRRLLESVWYRQRYGKSFELTVDQNLKVRFQNDRGGVRIATSVGGSATGEGGDVLVIDDAHKVEEARSATSREHVVEWFDFTMSTRLNDPAKGAIVVIGQRLHEADLFGHLLARGGWYHLCLPAEYDPLHPFVWERDPRTQAGELLWPERFGTEELEEIKRALGSYGAASQLQQLPAPAGGGIFKREWWRWYDPAQPLPKFESVLQSWDLTFVGGPTSDYVVGQVWGRTGPNSYLLRQVRKQMSFTETIPAIRKLTDWVDDQFPGHRGHTKLVEKAANGAAAIDVLTRELSSVIPVAPEGSKEMRAESVAPQVEAGNVWLPGYPDEGGTGFDRARTQRWVQDFVHEADSFPAGSHDDQIDAMAQALTRLSRPKARLHVLTAPFPPRRSFF